MEEGIINVLLSFVVLAAAWILLYVGRKPQGLTRRQRIMMGRILLSSAILLILQQIPAVTFDRIPYVGRWLRLDAYLVDYLIIGYDILRKAFRGICRGRVLDESFLMAVATVGAMALAIWENGAYLEAIAVMLFFQIGEWFEGYAVGKSRKNIAALMDIRPDFANLEQDGRLLQVDPEEVAVGSVILVRPGERVPLDGVILDGMSSLNTSALTGESVPRDVAPGDPVISGCINITGLLRIQTTRIFGESTVSRILDLVENASSRKSRSEDFISKFAAVYTPAVCICALLLALLPPVVQLLTTADPQWGVWLYRALTFLVISCPCALVISIPLSFFAGIGGASREGILVTGSNYLELLSKTRWVVFDKTGTLTKGSLEVSSLVNTTMEDRTILEHAALVESASSHPISNALQTAYGKTLSLNRVEALQEEPGKGVTALVDGVPVAAGNHRLMENLGLPCPACAHPGTQVHVAIDGAYAGCILLQDTLKPQSKEAMVALKKAGIRQTVMLTGDQEQTAQAVARELEIDQVHSGLLPGDKVQKLEELLADPSLRGKLAFVGDGINYAPVLTRADIGIAMGTMGSDAAIEAADVVLMDDDPRKIAKAIRISRKCLGIVYQNIIFALGVKFLCLALGAMGIASMYLAIFADVGVMVLAVLNAIRCLWVKNA